MTYASPLILNTPFTVVVASVEVPATAKVPVEIVVVANVLVPVTVRLVVNISVNNPISDLNTLLTERLDHTVLVPVVDELPTTMLPKSLTDNVDEPARFLI